MALIKCKECGKEISDKAEYCVHCGCPIEMSKEVKEKKEESKEKTTSKEKETSKKDKEVTTEKEEKNKEKDDKKEEKEEPSEEKEDDKKVEEEKEVKKETSAKEDVEYISIPVVKKVNPKVLIFGAIAIIFIYFLATSAKNDKKAIKVDIAMNSWYGSIETILDDFDIDFYAVTGGANCYSGVKTNKFETEKYGILYTEFSYCKSTSTQRFRIYNLESDQPLREPKAGELPTYSSYGTKTTDSTM